ncbi:hypothetical protein [Bacteroides sp.]|uniref:hypothetical protein n=1 Tax=Bacteroides sp. TaxID=29523 RepID=UPI0026145807|nr:hypothetical protein [Bacteroides sp.]MDD3040309.1 hypothetical protein [Bacteroides sp.]
MATERLGAAGKVTNMLMTDSVLVEIGGNIRRIELSNLRDVINEGGENLLRQIAWGIEIRDYQSATDWSASKIGNWLMWQEYESMCGRYMLAKNGKIAKLNPADSMIFTDGTSVTGSSAKGHDFMYYQPEYYYLVKTEPLTGKKYLWQSMYPIGGKKMDAMCIGAFKGIVDNRALRSLISVVPTTNKTIVEFWNAAQVNGPDFGITNYEHRVAMVIKALMKFGSTYTQGELGYGVCGSVVADLLTQSNALKTGHTTGLGDSYSSYNITLTGGTNCSRVSLGGIEDPYGWQGEMIQGVYCGNSYNAAQNGTEIFIYKGNRLPSDGELKTKPNGEYRQLTRLITSGWIQEIIAGDNFDIFSSKTGGGSSSYWTDYYWANSDGQLVFCGGKANDGTLGGLAAVYLSNPWSYSHTDLNARLAYYGPLQFVSGKELMA